MVYTGLTLSVGAPAIYVFASSVAFTDCAFSSNSVAHTGTPTTTGTYFTNGGVGRTHLAGPVAATLTPHHAGFIDRVIRIIFVGTGLMMVHDSVETMNLMAWLSQAVSFYDVGNPTTFLRTTFSGNMAKATGKSITLPLLVAPLLSTTAHPPWSALDRGTGTSVAYGGAVGITASGSTSPSFIDSTFTSNSVTSDDAGTPSKNVYARVRAGGPEISFCTHH